MKKLGHLTILKGLFGFRSLFIQCLFTLSVAFFSCLFASLYLITWLAKSSSQSEWLLLTLEALTSGNSLSKNCFWDCSNSFLRDWISVWFLSWNIDNNVFMMILINDTVGSKGTTQLYYVFDKITGNSLYSIAKCLTDTYGTLEKWKIYSNQNIFPWVFVEYTKGNTHQPIHQGYVTKIHHAQ